MDVKGYVEKDRKRKVVEGGERTGKGGYLSRNPRVPSYATGCCCCSPELFISAPRANNVFPMTSCRSNGGEWPHRCCHPANNVEYVEYVDCRQVWSPHPKRHLDTHIIIVIIIILFAPIIQQYAHLHQYNF